jgi:GLPGLI family protein
MKTFMIIVLAGLSLGLHAQKNSLSAEYYAILNNQEKQANLYVEGRQALFIYQTAPEGKGSTAEEKVNDRGERSWNIDIVSKDSIGTRYFTDLDNKEIVSRELLFTDGKSQAYVVNEDLTAIDWQLTQSAKKIGDFFCQEAIGVFRGRTYHAWFAPEIPVRVGPWKLHGLPGLVVEVYDEEKVAYFQLRSLKMPNDSGIKVQAPDAGERLSLPELVSIKEGTGEDFGKYLQSKLPRGVTFNISKVSHNWLEKEYEFQEK